MQYMKGLGKLVLCAVLVCSCAQVRYIEREVVKRDTTRTIVRDSVRFYDRDSVFIREKGDTIYQYVEKWRFRDRVRVDTFYRTRVDSVWVVQVREVERKLTPWQRFQMRGFWWLAGSFVIFLLISLVFLWRRLRK